MLRPPKGANACLYQAITYATCGFTNSRSPANRPYLSVRQRDAGSASDAGAARVKAQKKAEAKAATDKANVKSSKRNEFRNGE
jgi:hypothetical protein